MWRLWRRCLSHAWAFLRGTRSMLQLYGRISMILQMKRQGKNNGACAPNLLRQKTRRFCPPAFALPYPLFLPVSYSAQLGHHEEHDVGLVNEILQHVDAVSPLLFLCLVEVESGGDAEFASWGRWAIEESIGLDTIITSSFRGACGWGIR